MKTIYISLIYYDEKTPEKKHYCEVKYTAEMNQNDT